TDAPFELLGAPWIDGPRLAAALNALALPGIQAEPATFTPTSSNHQGQVCSGVRLTLTDRNRFDSTLFGLSLIETLAKLYPKQIDLMVNRRLIGSLETIRRLERGEAARIIQQSWNETLEQFRERRKKFLLYP
ncbi:MAG: serine hydrolase, partial [Acidobacteriota bacterium]